MKKQLLNLLFCSIGLFGFGQEITKTPKCLEEIKQINKKVDSLLKVYNTEKAVLSKLVKSLETTDDFDAKAIEIKDKRTELSKLITSINTYYKGFEYFKNQCNDGNLDDKQKEIYDQEIKKIDQIKIPPSINEDLKEQTKEEIQTYSYFGKDLVLKNDIFGKDGVKNNEQKVLQNIISQVNEKTHFGNITIPKENQEFSFCDENCDKKEGETYIFKKLDFEIYDGVFADIKVLIEYKGNLYWFSNVSGIATQRFSSLAKRNCIFYSHKESQTKDIDETILNNLRIRLSDVMSYSYTIGNNYSPHDLTVSLPTKNKDTNESLNKTSAVRYEIKQDTHLDKILDLRAYTDLMALFGDESTNANGLAQIEAKAKFYIHPQPYRFLWKTQIEFLKSIQPYVNYARFDEDERFVKITDNNNMGSFNDKFSLIQKRFLTMGADLNIIKIFHKDYPVSLGLNLNASYNISRAHTEFINPADTLTVTTSPYNVKSLSLGGDFVLATKRLNNFSFQGKVGFRWFDFENFNTLNIELVNPSLENAEPIGNSVVNTNFEIPVFRTEVEVSYHPNRNPNQAIFARLNTFNYKGDSDNSAFFQFQFGYKFSIGNRVNKGNENNL